MKRNEEIKPSLFPPEYLQHLQLHSHQRRMHLAITLVLFLIHLVRGKLYQLDIETILPLLYRHSGVLWARLPPTSRGKRPRQAQVTLIVGKVQECLILSDTGFVLLEGEQALQELRRLGILSWTYNAFTSSQNGEALSGRETYGQSSAPEKAPPSFLHPDSIPRRISTIGPQELRSFQDRHQRTVLSLIDGVRTCQDIARIMNIPWERLYPIISALLDKRAIVL